MIGQQYILNRHVSTLWNFCCEWFSSVLALYWQLLCTAVDVLDLFLLDIIDRVCFCVFVFLFLFKSVCFYSYEHSFLHILLLWFLFLFSCGEFLPLLNVFDLVLREGWVALQQSKFLLLWELGTVDCLLFFSCDSTVLPSSWYCIRNCLTVS